MIQEKSVEKPLTDGVNPCHVHEGPTMFFGEFLSPNGSYRDPHTNLHDLNGEIWDLGAE